jgi:hypothetical protein
MELDRFSDASFILYSSSFQMVFGAVIISGAWFHCDAVFLGGDVVWRLHRAKDVGIGGAGESGPRCSSRSWKIGCATAVPLVTIWVAVWFGQGSSVWAGGVARHEGAEKQAAVPDEVARFVGDVERRLRGCHERVVGLAKPIMAVVSTLDSLHDEATNRQIAASSAKANFGNTTLTREVAEIAIVEYEEGIFKQDQATVMGEVALAKSELKRAEDSIDILKQRLAKVKELSKGTATEVALEYTYEDRIADAELREPKARVALEQAETKLKVLQEYTKSKTVKELRAEVEKAKSDELAKKARWAIEESNLIRIDAVIKQKRTDTSADATVKLLERAFSVDERARAELARIKETGTLESARRKLVEDATKELEAVVDRVEAENAAAQVDRVKAAIRRFSGRAAVDAPKDEARAQASIPAEFSGVEPGLWRRLKSDHERILRLAIPMLDVLNGSVAPETDPAGQLASIEAAKASLKRATLVREIAEAELKEFSDRVVKHKASACERELSQAEAELKRAEKASDMAMERFEKIKGLSDGSATDLELEYNFGAGEVVAKLSEQRARFAMEQATSRLTVLKEYEAPRRTKELRAGIERARADELAKQAALELEQGKLRQLKRRSEQKDLPARDQKLLASLDRAFSIDSSIRAKVDLLVRNGKIDAGIQKEIQELANQLESEVDRAESGSAEARFDDFKKKIGRPPAR